MNPMWSYIITRVVLHTHVPNPVTLLVQIHVGSMKILVNEKFVKAV